jgi:hypothetical protein
VAALEVALVVEAEAEPAAAFKAAAEVTRQMILTAPTVHPPTPTSSSRQQFCGR